MSFGGFDEFVYTSGAASGDATPRGIMSRLNPILDTSNINVRGTGKRGLYDILLGMRQPQFTMDILPTDLAWIAAHMDGQNEIPHLHYRYKPTDKGLTFSSCYFNRISVESRHNEAITATVEVWAKSMDTLNLSMNYAPTHGVTPYRWFESRLSIGKPPAATVEERYWWSWRFEINNNLQRLGNTRTGATREIQARHRDVTGLIVKDLASFEEWINLMELSPEEGKINITIEYLGDTGVGTGSWTPIFDQDACRWGRLEAPTGPEDLQAKRFPFTAINYT